MNKNAICLGSWCRGQARLVATGDDREPYRVVGAGRRGRGAGVGVPAGPAGVGEVGGDLRSYAVDLLRWWRFLDAVDVAWDRASRAEARDFSCWIQLTVKQRLQTSRPRAARWSSRSPGAPNPVTGKPASGDGYAPSTVAHSETVLRRFYDFHRDAGTGPVLNPFPLDISRRGRRAHAHRNPMDEWKHERAGRYRPMVPRRIPRAIPDDWFNKLFAALASDRDRALVAFWISDRGAGLGAAGHAPVRRLPRRAARSAWSARARAPCSSSPRRPTRSCGTGSTSRNCCGSAFPGAGSSRPGGRCAGRTGR